MRLSAAIARGLVILCAASAGDAAAGAATTSSLVAEESAQRDVGVLSGDAAAGFERLAEEMEINFGEKKAEDARAARTVVTEVAERDAPSVAEEIARFRTAGDGAAAAEAAKIVGAQDEIRAKLGPLIDAGAKSLSVEALEEKAQALVASGQEARESAKKLAAGTLGKRSEKLTQEERAKLAGLADAESRAAQEIAQLEKSALEAARGAGVTADEKTRVEEALRAGRLEEAQRDARAASQAIGENKLGEAVGRVESTQRQLEVFTNALSGARRTADDLDGAGAKAPHEGEVPGGLEKRTEQALLQFETARAKMEALDDIIGRQEELKDRTEDSQGKPDELRRLSGAQEKLQQSLEDLAQQGADKGQKEGGEKGQAQKREEAGQARAQQAAQARSSEPQKGQEESGQSEGPGRRVRASGGEPTQEKTAQREALARAGTRSAPAGAGEKRAGPSGEAASAMRDAARALGRADGGNAVKSQAKAIAAMESERSGAARAAAGAAATLEAMIAAAGGAGGTAVWPEGLRALLAKAAGELDSAKTAEASGGGKRGAPPGRALEARGNAATGLRGLSPGAPGTLGENPGGGNWQARLPAGAPPDIVQSASGAFPQGYEEALKKYYEALAGSPPQEAQVRRR